MPCTESYVTTDYLHIQLWWGIKAKFTQVTQPAAKQLFPRGYNYRPKQRVLSNQKNKHPTLKVLSLRKTHLKVSGFLVLGCSREYDTLKSNKPAQTIKLQRQDQKTRVLSTAKQKSRRCHGTAGYLCSSVWQRSGWLASRWSSLWQTLPHMWNTSPTTRRVEVQIRTVRYITGPTEVQRINCTDLMTCLPEILARIM